MKYGIFSTAKKETFKSLSIAKKVFFLVLITSATIVYADEATTKTTTTGTTSLVKPTTNNDTAQDSVTVKITPCEVDSPCAAIRDTTTQVMGIVNSSTTSLDETTNSVKNIVIPKFDFRLMTKYALGNNWKLATPKQQDELTNLFQQLLIFTYSSAVSKFKNAKITLISSTTKDIGKDSKNKSASVISQVLLSTNGGNAQPVKVEYDLVKVGNKPWLAYDIKIEDASLVTTYRNQFNDVVQSSKIDGLTTQLKNKIATLSKAN